MFGNIFGSKPPKRSTPMVREPGYSAAATGRSPQETKPTYSKVFRWRLPDGVTQEPQTVEVIGSMTHWQKVPLLRDGRQDAWHVTVHHIPGGRTHHYAMLVDGQPCLDKNCDGLAVPHGHQEERYQMDTDRGPRVLMLFAQTK